MNDAVLQTMQSIWKRIETQLRIEAGFARMPAEAALRDFQPGATEEELQAAELALGMALPEEVRASYCIHNGSMWLGDPDQNLWRLCSLEEVVSFWNMLKPYAAGEKVDLAPTPHGYLGQIIDSDPENSTYHRWLAPNWQAFLATFAHDLEAGEYCYEEGDLTWS